MAFPSLQLSEAGALLPAPGTLAVHFLGNGVVEQFQVRPAEQEPCQPPGPHQHQHLPPSWEREGEREREGWDRRKKEREKVMDVRERGREKEMDERERGREGGERDTIHQPYHTQTRNVFWCSIYMNAFITVYRQT